MDESTPAQRPLDAGTWGIVDGLACNGFTAHAYAEVVRSFLEDSAVLTSGQPIPVLDLSAGSGRFGFDFLRAWQDLDGEGQGLPLRYILKAPTEETVDFWSQHPQLLNPLNQGRLDLARFDLAHDATLHWLQCGETVRPGSLETPLVVLANHAFSRLHHDAFAVVDGRLQEYRFPLDGPTEEDDTADPLRVGHDYRPIDGPVYNDPFLDGLLQTYAEEVVDGHVLLPLGALGVLRTLVDLAPRGLLVLYTDRGPVHPEAMRHTPPPNPAGPDGLALPVNHHALGRWVEALGGKSFLPRAPSGPVAMGAYLVAADTDLSAVTRCLDNALNGLGPAAFLALERQLFEQRDALSLPQLLAHLKLARWDTRSARLCLPRFRALAETRLSNAERRALVEAADRIWEAHFHLPEEFDLAFELGVLLESIGLPRRALVFFQRSLENHGVHTATFYNLGLCHYHLQEWDSARQCAAHALELDADNRSARELWSKVDRVSEGTASGAVAQAVEGGDPIAEALLSISVPPPLHPYTSNLEHLRAELALLNQRLIREVARWRATQPADAGREELAGERLTDFGADLVLETLDGPAFGGPLQEALPFADLAPRVALHAHREAEALAAGVDLRLASLAKRFDLDTFERAVVLLVLAPELDPRYERLFGYLNDDIQRRWPTVRLALRLFTQDAAERQAAAAQLAHHGTLSARRLVRVVAEEGPFPGLHRARGLRVEPRVLAFLTDPSHGAGSDPSSLDAGLASVLRVHTSDGLEPALGESAARPQVEALRATLTGEPLVVLLDGPDALLLRHVAAHLARAEQVLWLDGAALIGADDAEDLVARALLEVELSGLPLAVEGADHLKTEGRPARVLDALLSAPCSMPRFLTSAEPWRLPETCATEPRLTLQIPTPDQAARDMLWRRALGNLTDGLDLGELSGRFRLRSAQILAAAHEVLIRSRNAAPSREDLALDLFEACRAQCLVSLEGLAERVESVHGWDDLILPAPVKEKLRTIEGWLRFGHVVFDTWGFRERVGQGRGMAAMFAGTSGTGKTMAAGILGRVLGLDVYRIELSSVVSKYIGETEKNLARIFEAAESAHAILFFDEADALFGKRSEVKNAHDRHANIEVSYLLQRMEAYDGIAILATNIKDNLDVAFARRLQVVVEFPFPRVEDRERIWRRLFSERVPLAEEVDFGVLAQRFALSGGAIKNCAVNAALAAAVEGGVVDMEHLVGAVGREMEKLGY